MAELFVNFETQRDALGYIARPPITPKPNRTVGLGARLLSGRGEWITRRGGKLETIRPLDEWPMLFSLFAKKATNITGVVGFMCIAGPLRRAHHGSHGVDAGEIVAEAKTMAGLLTDLEQEPVLFRAVFAKGVRMGLLEATLRATPDQAGLRLEIRPRDLIDALWLQFAQHVSSGKRVRACLHCGNWFECGPGTPRRADATFCSREHKTAYFSLARSKGDRP